jgi:hypothetical protein
MVEQETREVRRASLKKARKLLRHILTETA